MLKRRGIPHKPRKRRKSTRGKWTLKKADSLFSAFIRARDGKCVKCGKRPPEVQLQCSHFWARGRKNTRYDPENCDALCAACHYWNTDCWENEKQGMYRDYKIEQLGIEGYNALQERARIHRKDKLAIARFIEKYPSYEQQLSL